MARGRREGNGGMAGGGEMAWSRAWAAVEKARRERAAAAGGEAGSAEGGGCTLMEGLGVAASTLQAASREILEGTGEPDAAGPLALLDCVLGSFRVEGEEWGEGQRHLEAGVEGLEAWRKANGPAEFSAPVQAALQSALNDLGMLWCNRDDDGRAEACLRRAEELYSEQKAGKVDAAARGDARSDKDVESSYTTTVFLLAQVWGKLGDPERSARYCGLTLGRQLKRPGSYSVSEWGQNATQLAGYYISQGQFLVAEHLLNAASAVTCSRPVGSEGKEVCPDGDEEAADVRANICIGWAKFHLSRLAGGDASTTAVEEEVLGGVLAFEALKLPAPSSLRGPCACSSYDEAREAFNASARNFRMALSHYKLDGWVTEHCTILIDVSNLYKQLVPFESDLHRKCVLHRHRVKALEPLVAALNAEAFGDLVHSLHLELAETYRAILELKLAGGRPPRKIQAAGGKAADHYRSFLRSFSSVGDPQEKHEDGVETHVLLACCNLSRVQQKVAASGGASLEKSLLQESLGMLEYVTAYWGVHPGVLDDGRLAAEQPLIEEMRDLLRAKLQLLASR